MPQEVKSGDKVHLFCHSLGLGPFANPDHPPSFAHPAIALRRGEHPKLVFGTSLDRSWQSYFAKYDTGQLSAKEQEVCEKMGMVPNFSLTVDEDENSAVVGVPYMIAADTVKEQLAKSFEDATGAFTVVDGKKTRIELPDLETLEPYDSRDRRWIEIFELLMRDAFYTPIANLTVVFE